MSEPMIYFAVPSDEFDEENNKFTSTQTFGKGVEGGTKHKDRNIII